MINTVMKRSVVLDSVNIYKTARVSVSLCRILWKCIVKVSAKITHCMKIKSVLLNFHRLLY